MFNLIKKDKEKEKDVNKKEKKDKKERMSQAELKSLEEMSIRRGFFHLNRGSSKKDSRSKLEISGPIPIKVASNLDLSLSDLDAEHTTSGTDVGSVEDTKRIDQDQIRSSVKERAAKFGELVKSNSAVVPRYPSTSYKNNAYDVPKVSNQKSRPYFRQGSKIRIHVPELVEKTFPGVDLQLPELVAPPVPDPRELKLKRRNTGDFGFSLRRTTMLDRQPDGDVYRRVVHFAEPGAASKDCALGLVPGDRLVEINGIKVDNKSRDEIVEMIRQSGESVLLKVQPILELSELNRSWLRTSRGPYKESFSVKVENKPDPDVDASPLKAVTKPGTDTACASSAEDTDCNAAMGGPDEGQKSGGKKVVKVVRRVVRRVLPAATEEQNRLAVSEAAKATAKSSGEDKDDISAGLASLMGRGRTKEHRPRTRNQDRKEDVKKEDDTEKGGEEEGCAETTQDSTSLIASESTSAHTLAPDCTPLAVPPLKPDPLAPPVGFIPAPKQNLYTPPTGFVPASKPSATPLKHNPLQRPAGFIPAPKLDPLAPPAGFIPKPRLVAVKKAERARGHKSFQPKPSEDPVAILQASHLAAKTKNEENVASERAWYHTEKVWLVHKDGFSLATLLKTEAGILPEGKVKIRLDSDGSLLDVDEDDVEKANPPFLERVEDLASLQYLNESSVMHSLRQRYGSNLVHTHAGPNMVIINPISAPSMYSEKVMQMFKGCRREDAAPHIYSMAQSAYRKLLTTRQDQSIVLLGKSGSGKTTNCQHIIQYLVTIAGSTNKTFSMEKWQAVYTVLEAFGNASSCMNGNASRFSHIVSLDFDQTGLLTSASIQTMLLEKMRVTRRPEGESTFHVFYYLLAGVDSSLRTELHLNHFAENNAFGITPQTKLEDKQRASQYFSKLQAAMRVLGVSSDEQRALWLVLGAIYHLGAAGATKAGRKQFARHEWAQKAAYLLGCTLEELSSSIFKHQAKGTLPRSGSLRQTSEENGTAEAGSKASAMECLEAAAAGLYSELFTILICLINRALKSGQLPLCSLLIVDTPGFQNPRLAKQDRGATFDDLCHNYTQERLQTLFYQRTFVQELERYKEENIEISLDESEPSTSFSVAVVDQASSQALVRSCRTDEARGLLWLMEEEVLQPGASEESLLARLFSYYGPAEGEIKGQTFLLKSEKDNHFLLGHSHGTDWVEYDARGWLNYAKQNPASINATGLLQESQKKIISALFMSRAGGATVLSGSIAGLEGVSQLSLRRVSSVRKTFASGVAAYKKKSVCIQIKLQVDALLDMVRRSRIHFVHCILPKADALKALTGSFFKGVESETQGEGGDSGLMQLDVALLRAQLRGSKLLHALRIYRQGYPDHMVFSEFRRRFDVLAPHLTKKHGRNYIVKDEQRAVEELLESLDLEKSSYHMGVSRLFFKAGTLAKLEEQRDEQTKRNLILFQAACRGYLARQAFKKRKIQDLAIRCIQKNIHKNRGVKDWPWWNLFTTVQPLIKVQLTEDQMRCKDEEIQMQKSKLEKVEKERNELRLNTDRLESRIADLLAELADERSTSESASQLLENETAERLRLEKDMKDLQAKFDAVKKQMEAQEMEVMEARLMKTSELNGELDDDDDDAGGEWRIKYNRAIRETEFTKKKLQQEFDDKLETEQQTKRHLERRLADLKTDNEDAQHSVQQLKKKCHKMTAELQDTQRHLEGLQSRNHDLEKKQRKFDHEQNQAQAEVQRERSLREKLAREKDTMVAEIFNIRQQLQEKDADLCAANMKAQQLEAELQDLSSQESKDEASLAKVKKQLRDLEAKVKDQEEELDEQAGTIQMLEQAKLRLEMEMERQRQGHTKDIESKDEEVDEIRRSCSKKLKQMEVQLEEEYDDKQKVLRERRELESKLLSAQDQVSRRDVESEKRLRKDLKRTKVLLADAQIMLDHLKSNAPSKREIAQFKNQLEESEFTCAAAVKARKSMELEIEDLHIQMEDVLKAKLSLEEQLSRLQREKNDMQTRTEEDQEDMNELMKKHKAAVAQSARDLGQISDLQAQLEEATKEKQEIQEKLHSLQSQLEFQEQSMVEKSLVSRQEAKIRELETKLEYERTQIKRLESLVGRLKENLEKMSEEKNQHIAAEDREKEQNKRMQRQIRDMKEEMADVSKKEAEASRKKHELEMDIESLEAANQSLQVDLKLAFKRIADLQAAIEDEMESDDNDDLINSLQDMVTKYQKRKNKTGQETDTDSEVEDRVYGVKSWLSKNKASSKPQSDEGSLKSARYAANADAKDVKEGKEKTSDGSQDGKDVEQNRSVSVMSSLSYRKRSNLKDSIGGTGDESSLFSTLKEQPDTPDHTSIRKAKSRSGDLQEDWKKSQTQEDFDDSVSSTGRARKSRWTSRSSPEFDKDSTISSLAPSRTSTRRAMPDDDDVKSTVSSVSRSSPRSLRRSSSWKEDGRSNSRLSLARSCGLSEFGVRLDDDDDGQSLAFTGGTSPYSPRSYARSLSTPARARSSEGDAPDTSDIKPVTHRNYLDPELEAAIDEVLSFKPIKFKRSKLDESSDEDADEKKEGRKTGDDEGLGCSKSSLFRSASGSALNYGGRSSSCRGRKDKKSKSTESEDSSSDDRHGRSGSRRKKGKKSKKRSKKKESESEDSSSSSESSSSDSTVSYRSSNSVKKSPKVPSDDERESVSGGGTPRKKDSKRKQKKMDNLMMKYLYRPDSD
ncbi:unconventional myosin-XVIIIa-like isoform X4 [Corythoichthys intestinalis]|uniref:unconventional myosin-XVIIIa-like isoform X4 n=1 Tax=Corythoichthys intestinalis TaxID=161448 RepID=UPI0025A67138|nr:unconventional myosin-XVIIIa-like isoform X4 [Corythoichthys intestinalis]